MPILTRLIIVLIGSTFLSNSLVVSTVSAISAEQKALLRKNVLYYDLGCSVDDTQGGNNEQVSNAPSGSGLGMIAGAIEYEAGMTIDTDGVGPHHGDATAQNQTSYANGRLNADKTNYFVLAPGWAAAKGLVLGDVALVQYKGKSAYAIYGDNYKGSSVHGEGSYRLAGVLGINNNPNTGGVQAGVKYAVFPGTHKKTNGTVDQAKIDEVGLEASGGVAPSSESTPRQTVSENCACPQDGLSSSSLGGLVGAENAEKAFNFFTSKGLSPLQAAAFVGNLDAESGINPKRVQSSGESEEIPSGRGYGIAQWTYPARQEGLKKHAQKLGKPHYDLEVQLDYIWYELTVKYKNVLIKLKKKKDVKEATLLIRAEYERPSVHADEKRYASANKYLSEFGDGAVTSSSSSGGSAANCACDPSGGSVASIDLKPIVKKYGLHSAIVKEFEGKVVGEVDSDKFPVTPASSMKVIMSDTLIREGVNLDRVVGIENDVLYDGSGDYGISSGTRHKIRDLITKSLSVSSNVASNQIMKEQGGPDGFTKNAQKYGYKNTTIKQYYSTSARAKNKSTIADQVNAMDHIFASSGEGYKVAQEALKQNADGYYGYKSLASKAGATSEVSSTVALAEIKGTRYILGVYKNSAENHSSPNNAIGKSLNEMEKAIESSVAEGGSGENCSSGENGDAAQKAMEYAWPEYHPPNYFKMKPEYEKAVRRAQADGRYVGGAEHPGIDCGGFVTTVMHDSGVDKQYNNTGRFRSHVGVQRDYMDAYPNKYEKIGRVSNTGRLEPGDIAIKHNNQHTYMYVGPVSEHPSFKGIAASASYSSSGSSWRTPMADDASDFKDYDWYRLKR